jgi:hypothetical protein
LEAESLKDNMAERWPVAVGAKAMLAVQVAEAAREDPHVLLAITKSAGFAPISVTLPIVSDEVPVLVRVIAFAAPLFPTATYTQLREAGLTDALPEPVAAPVPLSATD